MYAFPYFDDFVICYRIYEATDAMWYAWNAAQDFDVEAFEEMVTSSSPRPSPTPRATCDALRKKYIRVTSEHNPTAFAGYKIKQLPCSPSRCPSSSCAH